MALFRLWVAAARDLTQAVTRDLIQAVIQAVARALIQAASPARAAESMSSTRALRGS